MTDTASTPSLKVQDSSTGWLSALCFLAGVMAALGKTVAIITRSIFRSLFPAKGKSLHGEVVLITGAGHGLGRELALHFAAHGCTIVCVDINEKGNEQTVRDINDRFCLDTDTPTAYSFRCDVSDRVQVQKMAEDVLSSLGRVDILVNNAGIMPVQPILNAQPTEVVDVVNVNLLAHFWTLFAFLPGMIARNHGHLVAVSSLAGLSGLANKAPYSASKFAVTGLMDALTEELRLDSTNIKLTCVHPYFLHTRPDLPENLHVRIPELSPEVAALEIVEAVRHDVESITVPRNLLFWVNVLRTLPQDARHVWRDLFYTNVTPAATSSQQPTTLEHKT
ncbi:short-chain dehydrogenase/reductase family 16C member 6 [Anabrus simplex]|uniref:short-chain dehydrogenase/reductase family 16C member 6 n=1 Tax=Anabrus simplex TaxID=316456 RepID=UPI0035A35B9A